MEAWFHAPANAQSYSAEPEIRRALPVDPPTPSQIPAPSSSPVRIMTAIPADLPSSPPFLDTGSRDTVRLSAPAPMAPSPSPEGTAAPGDLPGSILIAPSGTRNQQSEAASQLAVADSFFERKQPEAAVPEYEKFLIVSSKETPGRDRALFRLGECQRLMGSTVASEVTFQKLTEEIPGGAFTPAAAFRLGELREARGYFDGAATSFDQAAKGAPEKSLRETALYREALCLEKSHQPGAAETLLKSLAEGVGDNPPRIQALMRLGENATDANRREEAAGCYRRILDSGAKGEFFYEAAVKLAILQSQLGNEGEARRLFDQVASSKDSGHWKSVAAFGALRIASGQGKTDEVLKLSPAALQGDEANRPEVLLLQGTALRKQGKNTQALSSYETVIKEFPGSKASSLASFQRLLVLHALRSDSLPAEIDSYLLTASNPADRARAQLLKAEDTLAKGKYQDAAVLYHAIDTTNLPSSYTPDILYKEAWALTQTTDKKGAETALSRFLESCPDESRTPGALAQRAILKQQEGDLAGALADFSQLEQCYPKSAEREIALEQKALLLGQQQDNKGMAETFSKLLAEFPKSKAVPRAHYWIGWNSLENKDYATAITELSAARSGDPKQFSERAGLRILMADYYLQRREEAAREAFAMKPSLVPPEVARWLGLEELKAGSPAKAEKLLSPLVREGLPGASDVEIQEALASAFLAQGKVREAQSPAAVCVKMAHDPASRARALLLSAEIQRSLKNLPQALSMTEEAMLLQPEGPINAEARILGGDIQMTRQDYAEAAKSFMTVGVLYEDPDLTPKALAKGAEAYRKSGNLIEAQKTLDELHRRYPNVAYPTTINP